MGKIKGKNTSKPTEKIINYTHPNPGILSHWPAIPPIRLLWMIITPLGLPVEPLVYIITARSEGTGFTNGMLTATQSTDTLFSSLLIEITNFDSDRCWVGELKRLISI